MKYLTIILLLLSNAIFSQPLIYIPIVTNVKATFRGLSVVDNSVAWVSGTNGTVGRSTNGGHNWQFTTVKDFEKADFRSLYAFDSLNAIAATTGSPACILRTGDGGKNWNIVYKNEDTSAFFDGIDFWNNKEGIIYGDPINGHMLMLSTIDGGHAWKQMPMNDRPLLQNGEASFAASGTGIRCAPYNKLIIVTGGAESRFFISGNQGKTWQFNPSPILKGKSTTGIFSVAWHHDTAIVVGGDYSNDTLSTSNIFLLYRHHNQFTWKAPVTPTRGYRECVEFIDQKTLVAAGPTGIDISTNIGFSWQTLSDEQELHVVRKSRKGNLIITAGSNGKIGILTIKK
jgi:hypothetical protein